LSERDIVADVAILWGCGVLLGAKFSVGHYTPAESSQFGWCVCNLQGSPLYLSRDAVDAYAHFLRYEDDPGSAPPTSEPPRAQPSPSTVEIHRLKRRWRMLQAHGFQRMR
jgi:hypothetical protein